MNTNLLEDARFFPLLNAGENMPVTDLMGVDALAFYTPADTRATRTTALRSPGLQWHEYGDMRWPSLAAWIEPMENLGVLVLGECIPVEDGVPSELTGLKMPPLRQIDASYRGDEFFESSERLYAELLSSTTDGPTNNSSVYVQSYRLYRRRSGEGIQPFADYTDQLNSDGVPIPAMRFARVEPAQVDSARVALHCLFTFCAMRQRGVPFIQINQHEDMTPVLRQEGTPVPLWENFHPRRIIKPRRYLQISGFNWKLGAMHIEDHERINEAIRRGTNRELLCVKREGRDGVRSFWFNESLTNSCFGAVVHREKGGAIYVIPDRLSQEFDHTDCGEVRVSDITLPFDDCFVSFSPPEPVYLDDGCAVDGCHLTKQHEELLVVITSRRESVDYSNSLPIAALDPIFSIHLPMVDPQITVREAVAAGVRDYLDRNKPPEDDFSQPIDLPDGASTYVADVRRTNRALRSQRYLLQQMAFDRCLNIVVNAACFISFRPDDIEDSWAGIPPTEMLAAAESSPTTRHARERKEGAIEKLDRGDYTRIKICGAKLFEFDPDQSNSSGTHASPRAHWRRGHWRRQKHGAGLLFITLKWIRPTIVKKEAGPMVDSRIYDIDGTALP